ncbi:putative MFS transporter Fmp42 [Aspergillus ruber CBS 135680]|uniref:MFS general substrate transporter n=1 Tax=Aspergillus ruber (strain CBS 135680) TaxID=1388766 RepID=A0A017RZQ9_ASPRC|nr:MFS general substrate transporter [Aspergillus ruber CBS 135680]EYE90162.1 MFS general substrate transporter [Aspergillus ruber CBS 135680]
MSLSRIPYFKWWEDNSGTSREDVGRTSVTESDEDAYLELPDDSVASSFSSSLSYVSRRRPTKPVAGRVWAESIENEAGVCPPNSGTRKQTGMESKDLPLDEPGIPKTTGAFEVDRHKRIAQVCIAALSCFLSGGIIFGFAAIKPILIKEGVYRDLCFPEELGQGVFVCYRQEIRLNLVFATAAVATNLSALPIGTILDTYGPRICGIISCCLLTIGSLFFVFARYIPFDAYITGYTLLALAGPFIYISSFHLSNTFPMCSGLILAMLTGAYDASTAVFMAFNLVNEYTDVFSMRHFFLIYLAIPLFILATQVTIMPAESYKTVGELVLQAEAHIAAESNPQNVHEASYHREIITKIQSFLTFPSSTRRITSSIGRYTPLLQQNPNSHPPQTQPQNHKDRILGILHNLPMHNQILSLYFILYALFTALTTLRINYFLATVHYQYSSLLHSPDLANHITRTFTILLPIGGIIAAPFTGIILDTLPTIPIAFILVIVGSILSLMNCIPSSLAAAYMAISLVSIYRPFFYASISDYAARVFGFRDFGTVYGLVIFVSAVVGFAQVGLDMLTLEEFRGREENGIVVVNWLFVGVIGVVGVLWVGVIWWRHCAIERRNLESVEERGPFLVNQVTENQYGSTGNL